MQTNGTVETEGGIRLQVEIKDEQYRHFDAYARRKGGCSASEVAQAMIDRHLTARAKGQALVPITEENHRLAFELAQLAHVPVETIINAALGGLRDLANWQDTRQLESLMDRWMADGTVPENKVERAKRAKAELKKHLADKDILGLAANRNAYSL